MSSRMRPLQKGRRIAGPAVTAFCAPGDNLMMHRALYLAQPGDVLVVVADGDGVICVPKGDAASVVQGALARMRREDEMAKAIERGEAIWDLGGSAASYAAMENIEEIDAAFDDR